MRRYPWSVTLSRSPSTVISWPCLVFSASVSSPGLSGMLYSLATIEPWDSMPPVSVTSPVTWLKMSSNNGEISTGMCSQHCFANQFNNLRFGQRRLVTFRLRNLQSVHALVTADDHMFFDAYNDENVVSTASIWAPIRARERVRPTV